VESAAEVLKAPSTTLPLVIIDNTPTKKKENFRNKTRIIERIKKKPTLGRTPLDGPNPLALAVPYCVVS